MIHRSFPSLRASNGIGALARVQQAEIDAVRSDSLSTVYMIAAAMLVVGFGVFWLAGKVA